MFGYRSNNSNNSDLFFLCCAFLSPFNVFESFHRRHAGIDDQQKTRQPNRRFETRSVSLAKRFVARKNQSQRYGLFQFFVWRGVTKILTVLLFLSFFLVLIAALSEELENPMNVHRWRKLEGSDPATYEMIQKIQTLQKRLIMKTEEVVEKDLLIQEKEKLYVELKNILARQPGPEVAEQLSVYQHNLKEKVTFSRLCQAFWLVLFRIVSLTIFFLLSLFVFLFCRHGK